MNKNRYKIIVMLSFLLVVFAGCKDADNNDLVSGGKLIKLTATLNTSETRANASIGENTLDLTTRWQSGDQITIFVANFDGIISIGTVPVREISSDGRTATFYYALPEDFETGALGLYRLICFTSDCVPILKNGQIYYNASLKRQALSQFKVPLFFDAEVRGEEPNARFQTYGTYELLHVRNATNQSMTFSLLGYDASPVWFRMKGALSLSDGIFDLNYESTQPAIDKSEVVTIAPNSSETIISWYIPNGNKINDAKVAAEINGNAIHSVNSKTSDMEILSGHAYHMHVTWNGKELKYDNGDIVSSDVGVIVNDIIGEDL